MQFHHVHHSIPSHPHIYTDPVPNPRDQKSLKARLFLNAVLQYLFCALRTTGHNTKFESSIEGHISECVFDTARKVSSWRGVDELKLKFSKYSNFYNGGTQQNNFESLLFLMGIMDRGNVPYSNDEYMAIS